MVAKHMKRPQKGAVALVNDQNDWEYPFGVSGVLRLGIILVSSLFSVVEKREPTY